MALSLDDLHVSSLAELGLFDYPPAATYGPRTLIDFELVWVLQGSATWRCGSHHEQLTAATSLLLCRPGMTDEFQWDDCRQTRHGYVHFSLDVADRSAVEDWPIVRHLASDDLLFGLLEYVLQLSESAEPAAEQRALDVMRLLLTAFVDGPLVGRSEPPSLPAPLEAAFDAVRQLWSGGAMRALSVEELARAAAVSPSQLSRLFRARFGVGPVTAQELLRLARAEQLLLRSNMTIGAIAGECGFADAYHFSRRFKAIYGQPPRAFRTEGPTAGHTSPAARAGLLSAHRPAADWAATGRA